MNDDFMVFSGTANLPLAEKVANYLGRPLDKIDIKHFPDGETFCQVIDSVRGRDVFVIQSGSPAPNSTRGAMRGFVSGQSRAEPTKMRRVAQDCDPKTYMYMSSGRKV